MGNTDGNGSDGFACIPIRFSNRLRKLGCCSSSSLLYTTLGIAYPAKSAFFVERFPTKYRASGVNSAYQISQVQRGGLAPILATYIVSALHGAEFAWAYLVVLIIVYGVIAIAGMPTLRETKDIDMAAMQA